MQSMLIMWFHMQGKTCYTRKYLSGDMHILNMFVTPPPSLLDFTLQMMDSRTFWEYTVYQTTAYKQEYSSFQALLAWTGFKLPLAELYKLRDPQSGNLLVPGIVVS